MTTWFVCIFFIASAATLILKRSATIGKEVVLIALTLKLLAGICLGFIYQYYYGEGDTLVYFELACQLSDLPLKAHWQALSQQAFFPDLENQPRVAFFVNVLSIFTRISGGSYWIASLYLSLISFAATLYSVIVLSKLYPTHKPVFIASLLFVPSVVFWTSGVTKDALAFAGVAFIISFALKLYHTSKATLFEWLLLVISIYILFKIRHYLLISTILFSGALAFFFMYKRLSLRWSIVAGASLIIVLGISTQNIHPYLNISRLPLTLFEINEAIINKTSAEDYIGLKMADATWGEVFKHLPKAIFYGLFKPNLFDTTIIWGWIHRVENFILLVLAVASIFLFIKHKRAIKAPMWAGGLVILLLAAMLTLSTPNFGSLVRYKSAFVPYLFIILSILPYQYLFRKTKT